MFLSKFDSKLKLVDAAALEIESGGLSVLFGLRTTTVKHASPAFSRDTTEQHTKLLNPEHMEQQPPIQLLAWTNTHSG